MKKKEMFLSIVLLFLIVSCNTTPMYNKKYIKNATYENDFYTAVNGEWILENKNLPLMIWEKTNSNIVADEVDKNLINILNELIKKENKTRKEQMLVDFYSSGINLEQRNNQGYKPIEKYIQNYKNAKNIHELLEAEVQVYKELGLFSLFTSSAGYYPEFLALEPSDLSIFSDGTKKNRYREVLKKLLLLTNFDNDTAIEISESVVNFEAEIAKNALSYIERQANSNMIIYSFHVIKNLFSEFDFEKLYKKCGLPLTSDLIVRDFELTKKTASYFTNENIEILRNFAICRLLLRSSWYLSDKFINQGNEFYSIVYGGSKPYVNEQYLQQETLSKIKAYFPSYLEEIFIEKFCSLEIKEKITSISNEIIQEYKNILTNTTLLNEKAKNVAIKKLERMTMKIAYPEKIIDFYANLESLNSKNFIQNIGFTSKSKSLWKLNHKEYFESKNTWMEPVFTINAFYYLASNSFTIHAGFLQDPYYKDDFTYEQLLGSIGTVIAHEISHAFDKTCVNYNHNGFYSYIWDKDSLANYDKWCENIVELYDGYPDFYGVKNNGLSTLNENIADILGMQVCLEVLKTKENPNYKEFFESYAFRRKSVLSKNNLIFYVNHDEHATPRARVNRVVSNFQEFYDTYGITKKDAMYIPLEKRVKF